MNTSGSARQRNSFLTIRLTVLITSLMLTFIAGGCIVVDDTHNGSTADVEIAFNPERVTPVYDSYYREWRWYFDVRIDEYRGIGVSLNSLSVAFYDLNGAYQYTEDYSSQIDDWFSSYRLPGDGTLWHEGAYWTNADGSGYGWQAVFTIRGTDDNGHSVSASGTVVCLDAPQSGAMLGCSFSPNPVYPEYNTTYNEYRWYFDWSVFEQNGYSVTLTELYIDHYDRYGNFEYSEDYSAYIRDWFGTNYLPGNAMLTCYDHYWTNADGSGQGWSMQYRYFGRDSLGNDVSCSGWVTLRDSQYAKDAVDKNVDAVTPKRRFLHSTQSAKLHSMLRSPGSGKHMLN